MSDGSAASLHGRVPQGLLSPSPTVRSRPFVLFPQSAGALSPPRHLPLQAAGEPPRGRVLIVDEDAPTSLMLQKLLQELGYRVVGPAEGPADATALVERGPSHWPIDCALVSGKVVDAAHAADQLRRRDVPVVWTMPYGVDAPSYLLSGDPIVRTPTDGETLFIAIKRAIQGPDTPSIYATPPPQEAWPRVFPQL